MTRIALEGGIILLLRIVTSAIRRALGQQLAELEDQAKRSAEYAMGRGKNGKGRNEAACAFTTNGPEGLGG